MKQNRRYCGIAAIVAVVLFLISIGYIINSGQASYTPTNPVIASWDAVTNIPKNITANGTFSTEVAIVTMPGARLTQAAQPLANQDDAIRWSVDFPDTSPHTLYVRGSTSSVSGIITVSIDGVNQSGTMDWYEASQRHNIIYSTQIVPARIGKNAMQFWIATKNPSSSDYMIWISEWWII